MQFYTLIFYRSSADSIRESYKNILIVEDNPAALDDARRIGHQTQGGHRAVAILHTLVSPTSQPQCPFMR